MHHTKSSQAKLFCLSPSSWGFFSSTDYWSLLLKRLINCFNWKKFFRRLGDYYSLKNVKKLCVRSLVMFILAFCIKDG